MKKSKNKYNKLAKEVVSRLHNKEFIVISYEDDKPEWHPSKYKYFYPGKNKIDAENFLRYILKRLKFKHRFGKINAKHLVGKVLSLNLLLNYK